MCGGVDGRALNMTMWGFEPVIVYEWDRAEERR
jgi:hypothetical protein